jgi:Domain of unknown function (DUF4440)
MPGHRTSAGVMLLLALCGLAIQMPAQSPPSKTPSKLNNLFEAKVKTEWDAFKNKDKKAYGGLLADDFIGVESDSRGTRNKIQAVNELDVQNVKNYTLFALDAIPLGDNAAFVTYESTMEFPVKAQVRYLRVYVSELWVRSGGEWKLRHSQETAVK